MVAAGTVDEKILTKAEKKTKVNRGPTLGFRKGRSRDGWLASHCLAILPRPRPSNLRSTPRSFLEPSISIPLAPHPPLPHHSLTIQSTQVNSALLDGSSSGSSKGNGQGDGLSSVSGILADALRTYLN